MGLTFGGHGGGWEWGRSIRIFSLLNPLGLGDPNSETNSFHPKYIFAQSFFANIGLTALNNSGKFVLLKLPRIYLQDVDDVNNTRKTLNTELNRATSPPDQNRLLSKHTTQKDRHRPSPPQKTHGS